MTTKTPIAKFGDLVATDLVKVSHDPRDLDGHGWWAVTQTFEGKFQAFQFAKVSQDTEHPEYLDSIPLDTWTTSMTQRQYEAAVESIREDIARGWVYQANLCRVLTANVSKPIDLEGLYGSLQRHNPAPHAGYLRIPEFDIEIASASPELFLARNGNALTSSPIKGTAKTSSDLLEKDSSENIMIVDLVRNDLSHACIKGSVHVDHLLRLEEHPGLVHLVSDVVGEVADDTSWLEILEMTSPPGSVSGAPKSSALETIGRLETAPRNFYCGAFGWVDADNRKANLAVGIRTFWQTSATGVTQVHFGTGAGITWESDPHGEWLETELKAQRLLEIAAGSIR